MIVPLEGSFLCGKIIGSTNLKVETGHLILCNEDVEKIWVLWGQLKGKDDVASDTELH